jgi:hypothetical protein
LQGRIIWITTSKSTLDKDLIGDLYAAVLFLEKTVSWKSFQLLHAKARSPEKIIQTIL